MRRLVGIMRVLLLSLLLLGCEQPKAYVECSPMGDGYQCALSHQGGPKLEACWSVAVECSNGVRSSANACQTVEPQGRASRFIPVGQSPRADECDQAVAVNIRDMVVEGRR